MRRLPLLLLFMLLSAVNAAAQDDAEFRMEIGGGLGTSFYNGDVNTKFYGNVGPSVGGVWRYLFDHRNALKASLSYGGVKGAADVDIDYYPQDVHTKEPSLEPLRYDFSSYVVDLSCLYELNFWPFGYYQNYLGHKRLTPFIQLGLGMTFVGEDKSLTANVPLGVGLKYRLGKRLNLTFDWRWHFTLSDKVDGLEAPLGISAGGFKNKDSYQITMLTLTYSFSAICPNCNKY